MASYYINNLNVIKAGTEAAGGIRIGPCVNGADLYLFFLNYSFAARYVEAWKSDDGGETWAAVDNANRPRMTTWYNTCQDGSLVRVLHEDWATDNLAISTFDMDGDVWADQDTGGPPPADPYMSMGGAIHLRSDDSLICAYQKWGATYREVAVVTWDAGVWGTPVTVISDTACAMLLLDAVLGPSDRLHVFGYRATGFTFRHRSVAADSSLGTLQTLSATPDGYSYSLRAVARSGGEIVLPWAKATVKDIYATRGASAVDPIWIEGLVTATYPYLREEDALSAVEVSGVLRLIWPKDLLGIAADDIYDNTESGGAWGADEKVTEGEQPYPWAVSGALAIVHYWPDADTPGWYYTPLQGALARYRVLP